MSCRIKDNKYYAPNGKESILFKDLEKAVGQEKARDLFILAYTPTFHNNVVIPLVNSNKQRLVDKMTKREGLLYKVVEANVNETIQMFQGKNKIGYIRLTPLENAYQVERVLLSVGVEKGQGFGQELYKQAIKYSLRQNKNFIADNNRTQDAQRVWDKLESLGIAKNNKVLAFPEESFDINGEIKAEKVLNYSARQNQTEETLSFVEQSQIKNTLMEFEGVDLFYTLKEAFYKDGLFNPTAESLRKSDLYSIYEINNILSDVNLQGKIKDTIEKMNNSDVELESPVFVESAEKINKVNILGKLINVNPLAKDSENSRKIPVINEQGEAINEEIVYTKAIKVVDDQRIVRAIDAIENAHYQVDTKKLEDKLTGWLANFGIDLPIIRKDILRDLRDFVVSPSKENVAKYVEKYREVFNIPITQKTQPVKTEELEKDLVYLETNKSEKEVFEELNLLKTELNNVYHRIERVDFEELKTALDLPSTTSELDAYKQYFNYPKEVRSQEQVVVSDFTGNFDYLTNEFIADFNIEILNNKSSDFYNSFKITERGIELRSNDVLTLDLVKSYIKDGVKLGKELEEYSLLSKNMPNLREKGTSDNKFSNRVEAINNPGSVKGTTSTVVRINEDILAVKNENSEYLNIDNEVYEMQSKQGDSSIYSKLDKNKDLNYFEMQPKAPKQITEDLIKTAEVEFSKVNKKYKKEDLEDNFECL